MTPRETIDRIEASGCRVVVASVHHTGTWYCLDLLKTVEGLDEVIELREVVDVRKKQNRIDGIGVVNLPENVDYEILGPSSILHLHLTGPTVHSRGVVEGWDLGHIRLLARKVPTLVPLRDPMSALISRQERHPGFDHNLILDGFQHLPQLEGMVHFLRIDRLTQNQLGTAVNRVIQQMGLEATEATQQYIRDDPRPNSRGRYPLKVIYEKGLVKDAGGFFPIEFERLLGMRSYLLPFLRRHGYKYMPWWGVAP